MYVCIGFIESLNMKYVIKDHNTIDIHTKKNKTVFIKDLFLQLCLFPTVETSTDLNIISWSIKTTFTNFKWNIKILWSQWLWIIGLSILGKHKTTYVDLMSAFMYNISICRISTKYFQPVFFFYLTKWSTLFSWLGVEGYEKSFVQQLQTIIICSNVTTLTIVFCKFNVPITYILGVNSLS